MNSPGSLIEELLARGVDDWVSAAELLDMASSAGVAEPNDRLTVAIGLATEAILRGLVEAGDVSEDGFTAWSCTPFEAIARVAETWLAREDSLVMPGEIVWLSNTDQGNEMAEGVSLHERRRMEP